MTARKRRSPTAKPTPTKRSAPGPATAPGSGSAPALGAGALAPGREDGPTPAEPSRWVRVTMLLAGLLIPQMILLGSSLWGGTLLLPLDLLAQGTVYLPKQPAGIGRPPKEPLLSDPVFEGEVHRRLVVDEVRAGRLPLWSPFNYCGHPLLAGNQPGVFSPYRILDYLWPSPVALAWSAVLRAVVGGVGAYLFFRRAMNVRWLAAAGAAWWFPLTGTLVLSGGYPGAAVVSFLPWVLLAADAAARRPGGRASVALAGATTAALLAGHAAFAGQVLLVGAAFFLARVWLSRSTRPGTAGERPAVEAAAAPPRWRGRVAPLAAGVAGLAGGFLLSAPQTLPTLDYLRSSNRIAGRVMGQGERPAGAAALVQLVLPYFYGSTQTGSQYVGPGIGNRVESAAGGYAGLLTAVALAPLAFVEPARRRWAAFWAGIAMLAVVPTVGVPVLDLPFRLPPLSLLRNNRLVFAVGLSVVALGALGLDALIGRPSLLRGRASKGATALGLVLAIGLAGWCGLKAAETPVGVPPSERQEAAGAATTTAAGPSDDPSADPAAAAAMNPAVLLWPDAWAPAAGYDVVSWFGLMYRNGLLVSALAGVGVLVVGWATGTGEASPRRRAAVAAGLAVAAAAELVASAAGVNVRSDPALYYPRLPWMDVAIAGGARVCGAGALPANVLLSHRIPDIRGYDGADPQPTVDLIRLAQDPGRPPASPGYAVTQWLAVDPRRPGPVADLLAVRYVVGRGPPPSGVPIAWTDQDYWLAENPRALPRATIPRGVRVMTDRVERLRALAADDHDPMAEAVVETPGPTAGKGTARIVEDSPTRVRVEVDMSRSGLVRLADAWDGGWRATYSGAPVDVLRVDHALRGVQVPAGRGVVEFTYEPASFRWGLILAVVGVCGLAGLAAVWRPARGGAPRQAAAAER